MAIPKANAGDTQIVKTGDVVYLNGVGSFDVDSQAITAYQWTLIGKPDGSTASLINPLTITPQFTVDIAGTYVAELIVTSNGEQSVASHVSISAKNDAAYTVDITWEEVVGAKTIADGGYVGDLLTIARAHVDAAVAENRLTNAQAGEIYTAMIPSAFQNGIGFAMQEELTEAKIRTEKDKELTAAANREVLTSQKALYARQTAGFDDNKHQKILETALGAWGVTYQDTEVPSSPTDVATNDGMDALFARAKLSNL